MKKDLVEIRNKIVANPNADFCQDELQDFRNWNPSSLNEDEQKFLVEEGERELFALGERFQKRFPTLLPKQYNAIYYKVIFKHLNTNLIRNQFR